MDHIAYVRISITAGDDDDVRSLIEEIAERLRERDLGLRSGSATVISVELDDSIAGRLLDAGGSRHDEREAMRAESEG